MNYQAFLIYLVCFFGFLHISVLADQDYYQLLGVPRDSDDQTIRRAFKKLSLKYHPDKYTGKDSEMAKNKFADIVNAYEVLADPEQRKIFNQFGEQGIKEGKGRQQQGNYNDMFGQHFYNGGGNQDIFFQSDVQKIDMSTITKFYRRREVWVIYFFKSNQKESINHRDLIKNVAQKYYGIFKVASVNCIEEEELCHEEFSSFVSPQIIVYPVNIRQEGRQYTGPMDLQKIANFAVQQMESFVQIVTDTTFNSWVNTFSENHKVLLFTEKKNTPPLYMALSKDLKETIKFGEVRSSNIELSQKFNIQSYPTLLVVTDPDTYQGVKYSGEFKKDQIMKYLRINAYIDKLGGQSKQKKQTKNSVRLSKSMSQNAETCGLSDSKLCLIAIVSLKQEAELLPILNVLANHYQDDPIRIFYVDKSEIEFSNIFEDEDINLDSPSIQLVKGKRQKYQFYKSELQYNQLIMFIDDALGGNGVFKKMLGTLNGNIFDNKQEL